MCMMYIHQSRHVWSLVFPAGAAMQLRRWRRHRQQQQQLFFQLSWSRQTRALHSLLSLSLCMCDERNVDYAQEMPMKTVSLFSMGKARSVHNIPVCLSLFSISPFSVALPACIRGSAVSSSSLFTAGARAQDCYETEMKVGDRSIARQQSSFPPLVNFSRDIKKED